MAISGALRSAASMPTSLESLPAPLLLDILEKQDSPTDLYSLIKASPACWGAFQSSKLSTLKNLLRNLIHHDTLADACMAASTPTRRDIGSTYPEERDIGSGIMPTMQTNFLAQYKSAKRDPDASFNQLTLPQLEGLCQLYDAVSFLVRDFQAGVSKECSQLSDFPGFEPPDLVGQDLPRLQRAFFRFEIRCKFFLYGCPRFERAYADQLWRSFHDGCDFVYQPWELEEVDTVGTYVMQRLFERFCDMETNILIPLAHDVTRRGKPLPAPTADARAASIPVEASGSSPLKLQSCLRKEVFEWCGLHDEDAWKPRRISPFDQFEWRIGHIGLPFMQRYLRLAEADFLDASLHAWSVLGGRPPPGVTARWSFFVAELGGNLHRGKFVEVPAAPPLGRPNPGWMAVWDRNQARGVSMFEKPFLRASGFVFWSKAPPDLLDKLFDRARPHNAHEIAEALYKNHRSDLGIAIGSPTLGACFEPQASSPKPCVSDRLRLTLDGCL